MGMALEAMRATRSRLDGLMSAAAQLAATEEPRHDGADSLAARLTQLLADEGLERHGAGGMSSLNADGTPLQLCLTTRASRWDVRLIADPACAIADPLQRAAISRRAAYAVLSDAKAEALRPLFDRSWAMLLASSPQQMQQYVEGVLWHGITLGSPGYAAYFDMTKEAPAAAWARIALWLSAISGFPTACTTLVDKLRPLALPMCAGIEGSDARKVRLKCYWRLRRATALAEFGLPLLEHPELRRFLATVIGARTLDGDGLVFAASVSPHDGEIYDVKIDVCAHCLQYTQDEWRLLLAELINSFGLSDSPVEALFWPATRISYVGFGVDRFGACRLNVYLGAAHG